MQVSLRPATIEDSAAIARLVEELGYPVSSQDMETRLAALIKEDRYLVIVATDPGGDLLGLINAERRLTIESGISFEITGLVVSSSARCAGVGGALVAAAETWARSHGASMMRVRSNVLRPEAHSFYAGRGYDLLKTQHCYTKSLQTKPEV
ncbi:MAG: GNAT family N-acetyltransferase [Natronospirillum sp.]|uniref:GNAT family N-acetyltransferase n=1 Tax=Natronospirillum sp. TaxID=2812955 RepID=UPI0025F76376|nr:GNAT family N-acetyltransferase [Natronospirillum sp.]MCH8552116.1 GNAT family N-acetyltransferase [Natronospirillum sp.]